MTRSEEATWRTPRELEGVKSRKKAIFEISVGGLDGNCCERLQRVSGLKVTLESRICAVGVAGRVAMDLLLGNRELCSGKALRHERLQVTHLGPHLAGIGCTTPEEHIAAVTAALEERPQVVVLDEAPASHSSWTAAFKQLMQEQETLHGFRGALVLVVAEESDAAKLLCSHRWRGGAGWLWQEPVVDELEILEDVLNQERSAATDLLLQEVGELSKEVFFDEDSVEKARDRGWALALLVEEAQCKDSACKPSAADKRLCGFMCYQISSKSAEFHIARLAVVAKNRGRGYGRHLMQWALQKAAMMPRSQCAWISLSALDEAVPFYEQYGFTDMTCDDLDDDEHIQTWMELKNISVIPEDSNDSSEEDQA